MDKKTLLAVVLSMGVILAYQLFLVPPQQTRPPAPPPAPTQQQAAPESPAPVLAPAPSPAPAVPAASEDVAHAVADQEQTTPREVTVSGGKYTVVVDNRGAVPTTWRLSDYPGPDGEPLELIPVVPPVSVGPLGLTFRDEALTASFADGLWLVEGEGGPLGPSNPTTRLIFTRTDPSGVRVTKVITFRYDSYLLDVEYEISNVGTSPRDLGCWLVWGPGLGREPAVAPFIPEPLTFDGAKLRRDKPKKDGESLAPSTGLAWLGIADRYFLAAFVPPPGELDAQVVRHDKATYTVGVGPRAAFLPPGTSARFSTALFVGPKSYDLLTGYGNGLDRAIDFGFFGLVGRPLLAVLKFFHRYVGNWGVAIILLTLLVKLALFPVTFNMYKSMRRMQELQPQMLALKKKYKDDPQALNREVMTLYREHKVNPMGGCLPMVIQIPVFFALYKVLSLAIELRGARFLHVPDLSVGEPTLGAFLEGIFSVFPAGLLPLKVLVILMGATMFVQQKLSPTTMDPRQAKMMLFFPVIMTAMFWNFSAGLVVYFLFSNILAIGEQTLIRRLSPAAPPAPEEGRKGRK